VIRRRTWTRLWVVALLASSSCTDAYLFNPDEGKAGAVDRAVSLRGEFCTESVDDVIRPIKLLFAMDTSQSMSVTDPNGTRATALVNLLNALPQSPEVYVGAFLFAGDVTWITTPDTTTCSGGAAGFRQLVTMDANCRAQLAQTLLAYAYGGGDGGANRDTTDFVKPLDAIFAAISRDISVTRSTSAQTAAPVRPRYQVIFLSDGAPRIDQDCDIEPRCKAIRQLGIGVGEVKLNTVYVNAALVSNVCPPSTGPSPSIGGGCLNVTGCNSTTCGQVAVQCDSTRLQTMADLGGGEFRSFRNGEPVNFLNFRFGGIKRSFIIKEALAYNLNARPNSPIDQPDSDGDGLSDEEERSLVLDFGGTLVPSPTDPTRMDTDGDGFSDGVEVYLHHRGGPFDPSPRPNGSNIDKGCPANLIGVDSDGDGLPDCDEMLLGTSSSTWDTDSDGLPDNDEWLANAISDPNKVMAAQPGSPDADADPDRDGLVNAVELRGHTDPSTADVGHLTMTAARYQIQLQPQKLSGGRQCYKVAIDNLLLVPTIDVGMGAGVNNIVLSVAQVAEDEMDMAPIYRVVKLKARYPIGGIKDPPDGVLVVQPSDFERKR
jgi:hypothetical protein